MRHFTTIILIGPPLWYLAIIIWAFIVTPTQPGHKHNLECFTRILQDERVISHFTTMGAGMAWTIAAYGAGYGGCKMLASENERRHCSDYGVISGAGTATVLMVASRHRAAIDEWLAYATDFGAAFREENVMVMRSENSTEQLEL